MSFGLLLQGLVGGAAQRCARYDGDVMLWCSTPYDIGNALDVEAMRDDAGMVMALQGGPPPSLAGSLCSLGKVPGPRDHTYSGYLVRENPWLQLQGRQHVC